MSNSNPASHLRPDEGTPRAWVVDHAAARTLKVFTGPSALRDAERFINKQPEDKVLAGFYGLDYGEYRSCCREYASPEADCPHVDDPS